MVWLVHVANTCKLVHEFSILWPNAIIPYIYVFYAPKMLLHHSYCNDDGDVSMIPIAVVTHYLPSATCNVQPSYWSYKCLHYYLNLLMKCRHSRCHLWDSSLYRSKHYWFSFVCMKSKVPSHCNFYNSLCHWVDFLALEDLMSPPLYQNSSNRPHLDFYSSPLTTSSHHVCNAATSNKNSKPMKISSWKGSFRSILG